MNAPHFNPFAIRFSGGGTRIVFRSEEAAVRQDAGCIAVFDSEIRTNSILPVSEIVGFSVLGTRSNVETALQLKALRDQVPFRPFTVFVFGEAEEEIRDPQDIMLTAEELIVGQGKCGEGA